MNLVEAPLAIVDLETTGTRPAADRVTEIGVLEVERFEVVSEWSTLVNPGVALPSEIQALTGITHEMLDNGSYADPFKRKSPAKSAAAHNDALLSDPRFHAQNVYAIAMRILARFEFALGRRVPRTFGVGRIGEQREDGQADLAVHSLKDLPTE